MSWSVAQQAGRFSRCVLALCSLLFLTATGTNAYSSDPNWSTKLDDDLRFYQTTEMGVLIAGTEKSLYALDSETGEVLWRRRNMRVDQSDLAPVVGTDLLLLSYEKSGRSRLEAVDIMTGNPLWQSDKVKGSIMHLAVDPDYELANNDRLADGESGFTDPPQNRAGCVCPHQRNRAGGRRRPQ